MRVLHSVFNVRTIHRPRHLDIYSTAYETKRCRSTQHLSYFDIATKQQNSCDDQSRVPQKEGEFDK